MEFTVTPEIKDEWTKHIIAVFSDALPSQGEAKVTHALEAIATEIFSEGRRAGLMEAGHPH